MAPRQGWAKALKMTRPASSPKRDCPKCGPPIGNPRGPALTVDAIIRVPGKGVVLIKRRNPPPGWALPGGFVDYGETLEEAVRREVSEETGLELESLLQFRAYSDPGRDPRFHTVTVVFTATAQGTPKAGDDAAEVGVFPAEALPGQVAFDHRAIIKDYLRSFPPPGGE